MQLIPVIDLMNGLAVHARAGDREHYRPIRTPLCAGSQAGPLAAALLTLAPFDTLYVADLDAIMHQGAMVNAALLEELCSLLGQRAGTLWLDAGWHDAGTAPWRRTLRLAAERARARLVWVIGSESLAPATAVPPEGVLSLDFRDGHFLGPAGLDVQAALWPARVIAMELSAVGAGQGPALATLRRLWRTALAAGRSEVKIYAAGGVRDAADIAALQQLQDPPLAGVLLASALHSGRIENTILQCMSGTRGLAKKMDTP